MSRASYVMKHSLSYSVCFRGFFLQPRKFKCVHVTTPSLDGHPRKFIRKKLENDQTSKILYLENFPIYGIAILYVYMCRATLANFTAEL